MNLRPLTPADRTDAVALWNRAATFDPISPQLFDEKVWEDPDYRAELAIAAVNGAEFTGFVHGVVRPTDAGPRGVVKLIAIDPSQQRRGLGTKLVAVLEQRLEALGARELRVGESPPNYLVPGVDLRYAGTLAFFTARGYEPWAEALNMEADLAAWATSRTPQAAETPAPYTIRRATPDDAIAVRELIDNQWPLWWGEVSRALANEPVTLFIAQAADRTIGFAAHDGNNRGTGWFGPMGTDPAWQGQGIGVRLLEAALADMHEQGVAVATIPWVAPVDFYARHAGAVVSRRFQRFRKSLNSATSL
jgi:mycothiol synthase